MSGALGAGRIDVLSGRRYTSLFPLDTGPVAAETDVRPPQESAAPERSTVNDVQRRRLLPLSAFLGLPVALLVVISPASAGRLCETDPCRADIDISGHSEPQPIYQGETSEIKLTPKNDGYDGAFGIDVQATVPYELKILSVTLYGGRSGCTVKGTFVRCDFGDFRREQEGVVRIKVCGTKPGFWITPAKVYSQGVDDPNGGNNQVSTTTGVLKPRDGKGSRTRCGRLNRFSGSGSAGSGSGNKASDSDSFSGGARTTVKVSSPQRPLRTGGVTATVTAGKAGRMVVSGEVNTRGGRIRLRSLSTRVRAGEKGRGKLRMSANAAAKIRRALKNDGRLRTTVRVRIDGKQQTKTQLYLRR